jgi:hypothetical protein
MKKFTLFLLVASLFLACNNENKDAKKNPNEITLRSEGKELELPYKVTKLSDWERGDDKNIPIPMILLRCYEIKDFVSIKNYLADTVEFNFNNGQFRGSKDQFVKFLKNFRDQRTNVQITMNDYETVTSKPRKEDWVSLWYTEIVTDRTGKVDSASVMDDYRIVNGKVAVIDTKHRRLGKNSI